VLLNSGIQAGSYKHASGGGFARAQRAAQVSHSSGLGGPTGGDQEARAGIREATSVTYSCFAGATIGRAVASDVSIHAESVGTLEAGAGVTLTDDVAVLHVARVFGLGGRRSPES
jgi:hypothetical protein